VPIWYKKRGALNDRFFSSIYGYSDIKKLLMRAIVSKDSVNLLLAGSPASSKTVFLMEIMKGLDNACYIAFWWRYCEA
jgi:hypothetical protein